MDYRVVSILAIMVASCLCAPEPRAWAHSCPCGKMYMPLCASDGKTYNNMCEFECYANFGKQLFVIKEGLC